MPAVFSCPRCRRSLRRNGQLTEADVIYDVFQCDECIDHWPLDGEVFEHALTFVVGPDNLARNGETFKPLQGDTSPPAQP